MYLYFRKLRLENWEKSDIYFTLGCLQTDQSDESSDEYDSDESSDECDSDESSDESPDGSSDESDSDDDSKRKWSFEAEAEVFVNGKRIGETYLSNRCRVTLAVYDFTCIEFSEYEKYSLNDTMPVEFHVTILTMTGIKRKFKNFDDDEAKKHSDEMLKIGEQQFYVYKSFLIYHSPNFKSLFTGNFEESQKSEMELKDINPDDFQDFLELIHGISLIKESTVNGILKLSDYFDAPIATERCEEFLSNRSEQSLEFKFRTAVQYKLEKLKKECISEMTKDTNYQELIPENASDFSPEVWKELFAKAVSFN